MKTATIAITTHEIKGNEEINVHKIFLIKRCNMAHGDPHLKILIKEILNACKSTVGKDEGKKNFFIFYLQENINIENLKVSSFFYHFSFQMKIILKKINVALEKTGFLYLPPRRYFIVSVSLR